MSKLFSSMVWIAFAMLGLALVTAPGGRSAKPAANTADPVLESFEREFNHRPVPEQAPRGESIDEDILYRDINRLSWSQGDEVYQAIRDCELATESTRDEQADCTL